MANKIKIAFPFIFFLLGTLVQGQDKSLYLQHNVPQSILLNPGIFYECRNYIGIPLLSSIKFNLGNTGFGFHDLVREGTGEQSQLMVFDVVNAEKKLAKNNFLKTQFSIGILDAGFLIKDYFVSFSISNYTDVRLSYPKSLVELRYGNWNLDDAAPVELSLTNTALNIINYTKIGIGTSKKISDLVSLGLRINYLKGSMGLNTPRSEIILETQDPIRWDFSTDYKIRSSFPIDLTYGNDGYIDNIGFDRIFEDPVQTFLLNKNHGLSFDLGGVYNYDSKTTVSASLLDLGFIRWKSNTNILQARGEFNYAGIDIDEANARGNNQGIIEDVIDSIGNQFTVEGSNGAFYQFLPLKLFAGVEYELHENLSAGFTTKTEIITKKIRPQAAISLFYTPFRFLKLSTHYSIMNNKLSEFGFGTVLGNRGFQFYFTTDHIPVLYVRETNSGLLIPYNSRTLNFQFGLNVIWGCRKKKEITKYCPAYN